MKKLIFLVLIVLNISQNSSFAQYDISIGTGSSSASGLLLYTSSSYPWCSRQISVYNYNEFISSGGSEGFLSKIRWYKANNAYHTQGTGILKIYMYQTNSTVSAIWMPNVVGGIKKVFEDSSVSITGNIEWKEFILDSLFKIVPNKNIVIMSEFYQISAPTGTPPTWRCFIDGSSYNSYFKDGIASSPPTNLDIRNQRLNVQFEMYSLSAIKVETTRENVLKCVGGKTNIAITNPQPNTTYTWRPSIGLDTTSGTSVNITTNNNSTYYVRAYDTILNTYSEDTFRVYNIKSNDLKVSVIKCSCPSKMDNAELSVSNPILDKSIIWQKLVGNSWVNVNTLDSTNYFINPVSSSNAFYRVKFSTDTCIQYSNVVRTTILNAPANIVKIDTNIINGDYQSITGIGGLFDAINCSGMVNNVTATIKSDLTENGTSPLLDKNNGYKLTINSDSNAHTLLFTTTNGLVLDGADSIIIDGGQNSLITINKPSMGPAIILKNSACNNKILNCNINSGSQGASIGIIAPSAISFEQSSSSVGNNNNEIDGCSITPINNQILLWGIFSKNTTTRDLNNIITNNSIYNVSEGGIQLSNFSNLTIKNNHIFFNKPVDNNSDFIGINLIDLRLNNNISNNYIGGNSKFASGHFTFFKKNEGLSLYQIIGIAIKLDIDATVNCEWNVIKNMRLNIPASQSGFEGIKIGYGTFNITNNTIGDPANDTSITISNTSNIPSELFYGIYASNGIGTIKNNTISGVRMLNKATSPNQNTNQSYGIFYSKSGSGGITIDSNNVHHVYSERGGSNIGIYASGGSNTKITNNDIHHILIKNKPISPMIGLKVEGNPSTNPSILVYKNKIHDIEINVDTSNNIFPSILLIGFQSTSRMTTQVYESNEIYNLKTKSRVGFNPSGIVKGISLDNSTSQAVFKSNYIHSIENLTKGQNSAIRAISLDNTKKATFINNMITLISDSNLNHVHLFGIHEELLAGSNTIYYNNTVLIETNGSLLNTIRTSSAYYKLSNTATEHKNNIYVNRRKNNQGKQYAFGGIFTDNNGNYSPNLDANYNIYYSSDSNQTFNSNNNSYSISAWKIFRGNGPNSDYNSYIQNPLFKKYPDLHLDLLGCPLQQNGKSNTIANTDFDNELRDTIPDIGADEVNINSIGFKLSSVKTTSCARNENIVIKSNIIGDNQLVWYRNGIQIPNENGDSIVVKPGAKYNCKKISSQCTVISDTITISYQLISDDFLSSDNTICIGQERILDAGVQSSKYVWNTGDTTRKISIRDTGIYFVLVYDILNSCDKIDTIHIIEGSKPNIHIGNDTLLCDSFNLTLYVNDTGSHYLWNTGDTSSNIIITQAGTYYVSVTKPNGCIGLDSIKIDNISMDADFKIINGPSSYLVHFTSFPQANAKYLWDFGDGKTSQLDSPYHTYSSNGTYVVKLNVTDSIYNCNAEKTEELILNINSVDNNLSVSVENIYPNPFSNTLNIQFNKLSDQVTNITIFDVLGKIVASTSKETIMLDDNIYYWNSEKYDSGVYTVKIEINGETYTRQVVLIR